MLSFNRYTQPVMVTAGQVTQERTMIVRTWHGCVPLKFASAFALHLEKTGVEHAKSTSGNLGATVRRQTQAQWEHFFLATWWEDLEAIRAFAGDDYHVAVTYKDDEQFELLSDPYVFQHHVQSVPPA